MAGEETLKKVGEAVARALGGGDIPTPVEFPVTPDMGELPVHPEKKSFVEAAAEKIKEFTEKVSKGVSETAKKFVKEGDRPRDARVLSVVQELIDAPEDVLADPAAMRRVGERLLRIMDESGPGMDTTREAHKYLRRITAEHTSLADLRLHGDVLSQWSAVDRLYDAEGRDALEGTGLDEKLKAYQQMLRYDEGKLHDTHKIAEQIQKLKEEGVNRNIPPEQVKDAVRRLNNVIRETEQAQTEMARAHGRNRFGQEIQVVRWGEVKNNFSKAKIRDDGDEFRQFGYIGPEEAELLSKGDEGVDEWAHRFLNKIYGFGRERAQPDLPEMSQWNEFERYIEWVYGEDSATVQTYRYLWKDFGRHQAIVTGILYQPGDAKDKTRWFRMLTGDDLEFYVRNFDYANYAMPLYEQAVMDILNDRRADYHAKLKWLKGEVKNPFQGFQIDKKHPDYEKNNDLKDLNELFEKDTVARDELYKLLKYKNSAGGAPLTKDQQLDMSQIGDALDTARGGVMLWDEDVINYSQLGMELQAMERQKIALDKKIASGVKLNEAEQFEFDRLTREIPLRSEKFYKNNGKSEGDLKNLDQNFSYSRVDREVYERLKTYLDARGEKVPEWKIKRAIWAARQGMIGSGHLVAISSFMGIRPVLEYSATGKDVMRSPAFEEYQRIFNPDLFMYRFTMGAEMGTTARDILQRNLLKSKGYKPDNLKELVEKYGHSYRHTPGANLSRAYLKFAEEDMGIPFTEMLSQGFFKGGGSYDASGWRLEKGVLDEIRNRFLRLKDTLPDGAILDNQALGIQLLINGPDKKEERLRIFNRMMERTPSKFLQLLGKDRDMVLKTHNMTEEDLQHLQRALSMAEMKLWDNEELKVVHVDLTSEKGFSEHVVPFLKKLGAPESRFGAYNGVLRDIKSVFEHERSADGGNKDKILLHSSLRDAWLNHDFPMTLMLSDFNWKDANLFQLGLIAFDRRGRDVEAMARARDAWMGLVAKPEFLSPQAPIETLKKLKEYRDAVNDYADSGTAEKAVYEMMRVFFEFNRNRALWTQSLPFLETLARRFAETDMSEVKDHWLFKRIIPHWKEISEKHIEKWPHSVAEAFSYSVRFTGWEGNAFDEQEIEKLISTAQDMGFFQEKPELANKLRKEFKTTMDFRLLGIARKYWWVVLLATIAIAATQAVEEKKSSH
ncbi:hypothetical protein HY949_00190 [Candidatus Gottesmanbacteria bacterium]|nr:hypothetical protein [Candidatus Gottesmanbacteria bacterium]